MKPFEYGDLIRHKDKKDNIYIFLGIVKKVNENYKHISESRMKIYCVVSDVSHYIGKVFYPFMMYEDHYETLSPSP